MLGLRYVSHVSPEQVQSMGTLRAAAAPRMPKDL